MLPWGPPSTLVSSLSTPRVVWPVEPVSPHQGEEAEALRSLGYVE
jgi:hypothetical protein